MNTQSYQAEQAEQSNVEPPLATPNRATRQHFGWAATATAMIAIGAGLTALVVGVTGGTNTDAPPSPGVTRPYGNELPPKGLDQRLYNLAEERSAVPPKGVDQRLYNLAEEWAAGQRLAGGHR